MKTPEELLIEIVGVQSDTGTRLECNLGEKLVELIREDTYFKIHPDQCGAYIDDDHLNRPVVWALKKGRTNKTLILNGHYDAVEIDCYGVLKPYALNPALLKEKMLETNLVNEDVKKHLRSSDWMFGRGTADMKCGIAINLHTLFSYDKGDINILFTAVSDEENLSAGARQAIGLYKKLKEQFDLDYKLAIVTEPDSFKEAGEPFNIMNGAGGKLLPVVVAKGRICHGATMLGGLNPCLIVAEIVRRVELSEDFQSRSCGCATHPPTTQFMKDLKETYDVSIPEYCAAGFNILFLHPTNPMDHMAKILQICKDAIEFTIGKYNKTFDAVTGTGILLDKKVEYYPEVFTVNELRERLKKNCPDFEERMGELEKKTMEMALDGKTTIQSAGVFYIKSMIEMSQTAQPMVVLGFVPPYYPSICNRFFNAEIPEMLGKLEERLNDEGKVQVVNGDFIPGPTDLSYFACVDPDENLKIMDSICLPEKAYEIDFKTLAELKIPSVQIGATCKNVHEISERVYLPDVNVNVPHIINAVIDMIK